MKIALSMNRILCGADIFIYIYDFYKNLKRNDNVKYKIK